MIGDPLAKAKKAVIPRREVKIDVLPRALRRVQIHASSQVVAAARTRTPPMMYVRRPLKVDAVVIDSAGRFWLRGRGVPAALEFVTLVFATLGAIVAAVTIAGTVGAATTGAMNPGMLAGWAIAAALASAVFAGAAYANSAAQRVARPVAWGVPEAFQVAHPLVRVEVRLGTGQFPHTSGPAYELFLKPPRGQSIEQLVEVIETAIATTVGVTGSASSAGASDPSEVAASVRRLS